MGRTGGRPAPPALPRRLLGADPPPLPIRRRGEDLCPPHNRTALSLLPSPHGFPLFHESALARPSRAAPHPPQASFRPPAARGAAASPGGPQRTPSRPASGKPAPSPQSRLGQQPQARGTPPPSAGRAGSSVATADADEDDADALRRRQAAARDALASASGAAAALMTSLAGRHLFGRLLFQARRRSLSPRRCAPSVSRIPHQRDAKRWASLAKCLSSPTRARACRFRCSAARGSSRSPPRARTESRARGPSPSSGSPTGPSSGCWTTKARAATFSRLHFYPRRKLPLPAALRDFAQGVLVRWRL